MINPRRFIVRLIFLITASVVTLPVLAQSTLTGFATAPAEHTWISIAVGQNNALWLGSADGHIAFSEDFGESFSIHQPGGDTSLNFTQLKAIGERELYALSSGRGQRSRLYTTRNHGFSWQPLHRAGGDQRLRCFDLIAGGEAWILGDSLNDEWHVVRSTNGNQWLTSRSGFDKQPQSNASAYSEAGECVRFRNDTWAMATSDGQTPRVMHKRRTSLRFTVVDFEAMPDFTAISSVWPLTNERVLVAGGNHHAEDSSATLLDLNRGEVNTLDVPFDEFIKHLHVQAGSLVIGSVNHIAWRPLAGDAWQQHNDINMAAMDCPEALDRNCIILTADGQLKSLELN